jgi:anaerobic ribonucleoside-triphosphate reductase
MNRIQRAIDIFLDAIINGTLAKGTCVACAVGNLVAAGAGAKIEYEIGFLKRVEFSCNYDNTSWGVLLLPYTQNETYKRRYNSAIDDISKTEFTIDELLKIEKAFEDNTKIRYREYPISTPEEIRKDQINGLKAVIKVMEEFDEIKENVYVDNFITNVNLIPI